MAVDTSAIAARRGLEFHHALDFGGRFLPPVEVDRVAAQTLPSGLSLTNLYEGEASVRLKDPSFSFTSTPPHATGSRYTSRQHLSPRQRRLLFHGGRRRRGGDGEARGALQWRREGASQDGQGENFLLQRLIPDWEKNEGLGAEHRSPRISDLKPSGGGGVEDPSSF